MSAQPLIKIALTDDHPIVIEGIRNLLLQQAGLKVMATYTNGSDLLAGLQQTLPDILLLDIHLPDMTGNEIVRIISKLYPELQIIALTSVDNVFDVKDMMQNGCSGYLLKSSPLPMLVDAINRVYNGEQFVAPNLKEQLVESLLRNNTDKPSNLKLTQREETLLTLLSEGKTNNEIAAKLFLSHRTIENNRLSLYQKLGVRNTASLIKVALQKGLIQ